MGRVRFPIVESPSYGPAAPGFGEGPDPVEKQNRTVVEAIPWGGRYIPEPESAFNTDPSKADILFQRPLPIGSTNGQEYHPSSIIRSSLNLYRFAHQGMVLDNRPGSLIRQPQIGETADLVEGG